MKKALKLRRSMADTHYPGGVVKWRLLMATRSAELIEFGKEMERRALRTSTIGKRMSILVRCEIELGHPLIDSTHLELRDWLDAHRLVAKTRYSYISHMSAFWKWALIEEVATKNPVLRLTRPRLRQGLPRPISTEDLETLIAQAPNATIRAMVILAAYAGLRCMEIAAIAAPDIVEGKHESLIHVVHGKGDRERVISVPPAIIQALHAHGIPAHGPVFIDHEGTALTPWKVSHMLRDHMHRCDVIASAHQLRHTYATETYRQSGDLRMVQELLGHSSLATTAIYTAWNKPGVAAVVAKLYT